ncbi:MAG: hypothetical protein V1767_00855 [Chloroflexota bacterium]
MSKLEQLVRITLADGSCIDFKRGNDGVLICREDSCVLLPNAPGHTTLELFALLEPLGDKITTEEENEDE